MGILDRLFGSAARDLRYAVRTILRSPGFALVIILSLGLGIGANVAIFSVLDAIFLRPLPVTSPARLVVLKLRRSNGSESSFTHPMYRWIRDKQQALDGLLAAGAFELRRAEVRGRLLEKTTCRLVSRNYFDVLGVNPVRGRSFGYGDGDAVAVISNRFWQRVFGGDPAVIGSLLRLNGVQTTIAGVAPSGFFGESAGLAPDVFLPVDLVPQLLPGADWLQNDRSYWLWLIGRLKPGVGQRDAEELIQRVNPKPDTRILLEPGGRGLDHLRRRFGAPLKVLMAAVTLLLLIACANVANILLARASARQGEISIRQAIGAGGSRVVRQLLTESLLLSLLGGAVALVIAAAGSRYLIAMVSLHDQPIALLAGLDSRTIWFTVALCAGTTVLFGLAPALHLGRMDAGRTIASGWHNGAGSSRQPGSKILVAVQVALSVVVVTGATLLVQSLRNLRNQDPGFATSNVASAQLTFTPTAEGVARLCRIAGPLTGRLMAMPGVRAAATSTYPIISTGYESDSVSLPGRPARDGETVHVNSVTAGFFETYRIGVLRGRVFAVTDNSTAPKVAIINQRLARVLFSGADPVGKTLSVGPVFDPRDSWQVIGMVRNTRYHNLRDDMPPQIYLPLDQRGAPGLFVGVRSSGAGQPVAAMLRQALTEVDPTVEVERMSTTAAEVEQSLNQENLMARLGTLFGLLALGLAWAGVYGTMSYAVARRTREIGVRSALGATPGALQIWVLQTALRPVAIGILAGVPMALAAGRIIRGFLFGVEPDNPLTLILTVSAIVAIALAAAWMPARAAAGVSPMTALRAG